MSLHNKQNNKKIIIKICIIVFFAVVVVIANAEKSFATGSEKIILLHHSTGGNLYNEGNVSSWFDNYNQNNGTNYLITERAYPTSPYPWNNYPFDWWNLWVTEDDNGNPRTPACDSSNPNIECLDALTQDYDVIIFKQCFPGADVLADMGTPDVSSSRKSLENYKEQYRALRREIDKYPNNLFIVWTLVPRHRLATNTGNATRAEQFVDWVKNDWLTEDGKSHPNINIFDFWGIVAESDLSPQNGQVNTLKYEYERSHTGSDSHPNTLANQTAGPLFGQSVVDSIGEFDGGDLMPIITGVTGEIANGNAVSINGGLFGVKSPAAPLRYLNFEDGVTGQEVPSNENNGGLYVDGMHQIVYDDTYHRFPGSQNLQQNFNNGAYGQTVGLNNLASIVSDKLYVHGYWRIKTYGHVPRNSKFLNIGYLFQHDENDQLTFQSRVDADNNSCGDTPAMMFSMHPQCPRISGSVNWSGDWSKMVGDDGHWHRIDSYIDASEASRWVNVDNVLWAVNSTTDMTKGCSQNSIGYVYFGHYWSNEHTGSFSGCAPTPEAQRWWDEIYIDTTQARVEICDSVNWVVRAHCEIQPPVVWNDANISVNFNQGSFNNDDIAYLYVVDENGNVNKNGYPITIGEGNNNPPTPITYNLSNFTSLVTNWLGIGDNNSDVNNDGIVNTRDLGIMMSGWE